MKVCPNCGFRDNPLWKPLFWKLYWEYMDAEDFTREYPHVQFKERKAEDQFYYYKQAGKTRKMVHRFPKGFESMANRKLFEKTPSEKLNNGGV